MKRLFVAIKIPPQQKLLNAYYNLRREFNHEKINWVQIENLHFTLKFIGNTHASDIQKLIDALKRIALSKQAFELEIENLGVFGSRYKPRVIWAGLKKSDSLFKLSESILTKLDKAGFKRDRQNFVPHITLGRIKNFRDKDLLRKTIDSYKYASFQKNHIKTFYLYESFLQKEGPRYEILESFDLQL